MIPRIALDLSLDGLTVLSRAPDDGPDAGRWWREGVVRLDSADLSGAMERLRTRVLARAGEDFTSILILPDSQILYTSLERDDRREEETIRALLKGRTPYEVEDLRFDHVRRGDRLQVAVAAVETLAEAEAFAVDFGFRPVAIVAAPDPTIYPGLPSFGPTAMASELLGGEKLDLALGTEFDVIAAPVPMPEPEPEPEATPEPRVASAPAGATPDPTPLEDEREPVSEPSPTDAVETASPAEAKSPTGPGGVPIFVRPKPPEPPATGGPSFSTRRRVGNDPEPARPAKPNLSSPPSEAPRPPAQEPPSSVPADPPPAALSASATTPTGEATPEKEATKLALPGLAREEAAATSRRGRWNAGLLLTLGLLAVLVLIGLGSVFFLGDREQEGRVTLLDPAAPSAVAWINSPEASPDRPAEVPAAPPGPQVDLAALLPPSDAEAVLDLETPNPATISVVSENVRPDIEPDGPPAAPQGPEDEAAGEPVVIPAPPSQSDVPNATPEVEPEAVADPVPGSSETAPDGSVAIDLGPRIDATPVETDSAEALPPATEDGTLAPGGYSVVRGQPDILPLPRPASPTADAITLADPEAEARREALLRTRPTPRPVVPDSNEEDAAVPDAVEDDAERIALAQLRPAPRPASIAAVGAADADAGDPEADRLTAEAEAALEAARGAAAASLAAGTSLAAVSSEPEEPASELALTRSGRPDARPASIEREAVRLATQRQQASTASTAQAAPAAPSSADRSTQTVRSAGGNVSRAATESNVLRLNRINLIGVYGRPSARRALVRLTNGRYVKVEVGDRLDRGRVTAIGERELSYQRGGRSIALRLPQT
jgi:hypothetical protein